MPCIERERLSYGTLMLSDRINLLFIFVQNKYIALNLNLDQSLIQEYNNQQKERAREKERDRERERENEKSLLALRFKCALFVFECY